MAALEFEVHLDIDELIEILKEQGWRPVKRGRWVDDYNETEYPLFRKAWKCSACGFRTSYGKPKYCMNCGARMDGDENG